MNVSKNLRESALELKSVKTLTTAAMLLALSVIFGILGNYTVLLFPSAKISFSLIPVAISGLLFGPFVGGATGALSDIISFMINPQGGAFFPGWTLNAFLNGFIFGLVLYKLKNTVLRISIARVLTSIFVSLGLGTLWLNIQFGMPYWITFSTRAVKQIIFVPIEIALIFFISKFVIKVVNRGK